MTCQIVSLEHIKTDSSKVGKIGGISEWSVPADSTGTRLVVKTK